MLKIASYVEGYHFLIIMQPLYYVDTYLSSHMVDTTQNQMPPQHFSLEANGISVYITKWLPRVGSEPMHLVTAKHVDDEYLVLILQPIMSMSQK